MSQKTTNNLCKTCHFYHGMSGIVCALHPDGPTGKHCLDWQREVTQVSKPNNRRREEKRRQKIFFLRATIFALAVGGFLWQFLLLIKLFPFNYIPTYEDYVTIAVKANKSNISPNPYLLLSLYRSFMALLALVHVYLAFSTLKNDNYDSVFSSPLESNVAMIVTAIAPDLAFGIIAMSR